MRIRSGLWFVFGLAAGAAAGVGGARWWAARRLAPVTTAGVFQDVLAAIRQSFVDSLSDEELYVKAAKGVVSTLGDPYSSFLSPAEFRRYREILRGQGQSVGVTLADGAGGLRIRSVIGGSPADRAGVEPGQYVLRIGDRETGGMSVAKAAWALEDTAEVRIRVRTPGDSAPMDLVLVPHFLRLPAVTQTAWLGHGLGYVTIRSVSDNAASQLESALDHLDAEHLSGLIVDLRGNLGGRLDQAIAIAELFLDPGERIGAMMKRQDFPAVYAASEPQAYPRLPVVLLVDRHTASSAEIIASALRDNHRARLVGERTYGKGMVQTTIPLGDSIAVRLSTGRWKTPAGLTIVGGLVPDSVVVMSEARQHLVGLLAHHPEAVAGFLETAARARLTAGPASADSATLTPIELDRLADLLRRQGLRVSARTLESHGDLFTPELHRLMARLGGDGRAQDRWTLLADPVVAAGVDLLTPGPAPAGASGSHLPD